MALFNSSNLHGIIPPIVSPLHAHGSIDTPALGRLMDHLVVGGCSGAFALGTTGEGVGLSYKKRQQLIEASAESLAGRIPLLVGVTDTCLEEAIDLAEFSADAGASAVVVAPPYYLPIDQSQLTRYFLMLAESVRIPVVLYNMPSCCKTVIEASTLLTLADHPNVVGLKDSSGDIAYFRRMVGLLEGRDFPVMIGPEHLLWTALRAGGTGGVNGGALMWPQLYSTLCNAHVAGNRELAAACDAMIQKVNQCVYKERGGRRMTTEAIKVVLEAKGICQRWVAPPLETISESAGLELLESVALLESELQGLVRIDRQFAAT